MMKAGFSKKFWAFLLALLMVTAMLPLTALAEGEPQEPADTVQPANIAQPAEAPLLSGLSIKYGDLELLTGFSKDNYSYSIDAAAGVDKVVITATPEAESDAVSGAGEVILITGENVLQVTVSRTAHGSEPMVREYVITIDRAAQDVSGDCSLASLKVTAGEIELMLDPAFSPEVTEYKIATDALTVNIEAAASGAGAKVEGTGLRELAEGDNVFKVTVTAAEGAVKEYSITVTTPFGISAEAVSDYTFSVSGGKATITGYRGPGGKITTPTMYGTHPVTAIGACAFAGNGSITGITISSGVTSIGELAFAGSMNIGTVTLPSSLVSIGTNAFFNIDIIGISIPKNVSTIGAEAFRNCDNLAAINVDPLNAKYSSASGVLFTHDRTKLIQYPGGKSGASYTVPSGVTAIVDFAFEKTSLKSVVIPGSVTVIGQQAFANCSRLESVNIPEGVTTIGESAFNSCPKLKEINIPASVQTIGSQAFFECWSLEAINVDALNTVYASEDGVLFNNDKKMLIQYPAGKSGTSYSIPGTTETIGEYAFACSALRDITIPGSVTSGVTSGVTSIETQAFYYCNNLYSIEIPESVANMDRSFESCRELTDVVFMGDCPPEDSYDFIDCGALTVYYPAGNSGFPSDWNGRAVAAFDPFAEHTLTYNGNGAEEGSAPAGGAYKYGDPVTMPGSGGLVKQPYDFSGWNVMESCAGIGYGEGETYRMGPHDVTLYADWQTGCKLKSLQVFCDAEGNSYEFLLDPAFSPDVLEYSIEVSNDIDNVDVEAKPVFTGDCVDLDSGYPLDVGENDIYVTVTSKDGAERTYTIAITRLPATGEKTFGYFKYKDEGDYIRITKYTGKEAYVTVPDTIDFKPVAKIGLGAFKDNQYIKNVALQSGITDIDGAAFEYCFHLESISLPDTLKNIGSEAFYNCMKLGSVYLPDSLINIGSSAFSYCYELTSISIPNSVAGIGEPFLAGCEKIETIITGSNPNFTAQDGVLFNAAETRLIRYPAKKSGASYSIPLTVKAIDETAFDSAQVGSIVIPEGVTVLDYSTFANCGNLSSITLPDSLAEIRPWAFYNCASLEGVNIPKNLSDVSGDAFIGCTGLTSVSVAAENENYVSEDGVLYSSGGYGLVYCPAARETSFAIPSSAKSIDYFAFVSSRLKQIDIGAGITFIDTYAFRDCDNLTSVTIPDNVKEIYWRAFDNCDNLCTVDIGTGASNVDCDAFYDCPKLAAVYFSGDAPDIESGIGSASAGKKFTNSANKFKADLERAPLELKERYGGLVKTQGIVRAQATPKLFQGCSSSLTVYKASGTHEYTNPWYGRPVKTFYPSQTYTVKFSLNGKAGDPVANQTVYKYGKAAQPLNPVNPYNRFLGWYKEASCVNKWSFATNTVSSNITLYAKWTNKSVITAKPNSTHYGKAEGGKTYTDGETVPLKATPYAGYRFLYWTEPQNGENVIVSYEAQFSFPALGNRTITAQFVAIMKPEITSITSTSPKYSSVSLKWSAAEGAKSYNVYRATSSTGTYKKTAWDQSQEDGYTDTNLTPGKTYYYKVSAVCEGTTATTEGAKSSYKSFKPTWQTLNLKASSDHNYGVELSWNKIEDADSYKVYRNTSSSGTYSELDGNVTTTSYTDTTADLKTTYYYRVKPVDEIAGSDDIEGPLSAYAKGKAAWELITLTATAEDYDSISLDWNDVTDADSYYVWRKEGSGDFIRLPDEEEESSYREDNLADSVTYYYKVQAIDKAHDAIGPESVVKSVKPAWPALKITATVKNYHSIDLSWNAIPEADAYEIQRSMSSLTGYGTVGEVTETYFTDDDISRLEVGKTYYYRIIPKDGAAGASGPASAYKSIKLDWPKLNLTASANYRSVTLSWNRVDGADKYDVYRGTSSTYIKEKIAPDISETEYTDSSSKLTLGKTYYYRVVPKDSVNVKENRNTGYKSAKVAWPALNLKASSNGYNSIILTWNAVSGATKYEIRRGTSSANISTPLGDTASLSYTGSGTTGLTPGKAYYYQVRPVDGDRSVNGSYCSYKYTKPVPSAPEAALRNFSGGIIGAWPIVDGASGYEVYRATSKSGTYKKVITTAGLSFWDVPLTPGKTYYYKVRAYTLAGTTKVYGTYSKVESLKD